MSLAIIVLIIAVLLIFATGKLIEQQPASRIIQGVIAIIAVLFILNRAGIV